VKILIADDDRVSRHLLQGTLASMGHDAIAADNGTAAMQALMAADGPRLAVLDWMMPGVDGVEVCRMVRRRTTPYTYIILLTARDRHADMLHALDAGADDFLKKPCDAVELRVRLKAGERIVSLQQDLLDAQAALTFEATHDRLTGLWNRGTVLDHLSRELSRAQRERSTMAVLLADIDHFKRINDEYGHAMGDRVLSELGARMRSVLRDYDSLGRYGGEEFLVVLPSADLATAREVAERMRASVSATPISDGSGIVRASTSIGVAATASLGYDAGVLVRAADAALYQAKAGGRNQVVVSAGAPDERAPVPSTIGALKGAVRELTRAFRP
jgi:diguanylate cyclase (GGDEF)-like protein